MSTRSISWGQRRPVRKAGNLPPSCAVVTKYGNLEPLGPSGPIAGLLYLYCQKKVKVQSHVWMVISYNIIVPCFVQDILRRRQNFRHEVLTWAINASKLGRKNISPNRAQKSTALFKGARLSSILVKIKSVSLYNCRNVYTKFCTSKQLVRIVTTAIRNTLFL